MKKKLFRPRNRVAVSLQERRAVLQGLAAASVLGPLSGCGGGGGDGENSAGDGISTAPPSTTPDPPPSTPDPARAPAPDPAPQPAPDPAPAPQQFVHPGLLHTEEDLTRMRAKVAAGEQPWTAGFGALMGTGRAHLGNSPRPLEIVNRASGDNNSAQMYDRRNPLLRDHGDDCERRDSPIG